MVRRDAHLTGAGVRSLVLVLGDQLDLRAAAFDGHDASRDVVCMAEASDEATHVWSGKQRIAIFLAAMRHFSEALRAEGRQVDYSACDEPGAPPSLQAALTAAIARWRPERLVMTAPGEWRVLQAIRAVAEQTGVPLDVRVDRHFYDSVRGFAAHAAGRKTLRLETYYRAMRRSHGVLMDDGEPAGGQWNFDTENREAFGRDGPVDLPAPPRFAPDAITRGDLTLVETRYADHPGSLASFGWAVTRTDALVALDAFVTERLPLFGRYQDALWPGEPGLYHSLLSSALNLKLLDPREVVQAVEAAYRAGKVPLSSAEGFIRQIIGWREYVRGVYWTQMPEYIDLNALDATADLPAWYWTGRTDMACLHDAIDATLANGYAHHIQRLMVTGLYALLLGVEPQQVHGWYLAVYVDAVEWVELPNVYGMSQYADGGLMASKPYIATGRYIQRMGGPCASCRYDPALRVGDTACPFTTLYWDFLMRHETLLAANQRMRLQVVNLARVDASERAAVRERADAIRAGRIGGQPAMAGTGAEPSASMVTDHGDLLTGLDRGGAA